MKSAMPALHSCLVSPRRAKLNPSDPNERRPRDIRHDCLLCHALKVPIWNATHNQDGPQRHDRLFLRDGNVSLGSGSVRYLCKGRDTPISGGMRVTHSPPTDHHQTLTRNVSFFRFPSQVTIDQPLISCAEVEVSCESHNDD